MNIILAAQTLLRSTALGLLLYKELKGLNLLKLLVTTFRTWINRNTVHLNCPITSEIVFMQSRSAVGEWCSDISNRR